MNAPNQETAPGAAPPGPARTEAEPTGLPGLRNWTAVYVFVLGCFLISLGLLVILTRTYR